MHIAAGVANRLHKLTFTQYGNMKKFFSGIILLSLAACNNGAREGGTIDDGIKPIDQNGALSDTGRPLTDTITGIENKTRTDIQQRDTFHVQGQ